ncbi:MAG TPA: DUF4365 domain-containing protein [Cyclobacteriaceae bacterium]|nr:DUF4365 domain-containing protein [Cyclobacteriaceae bacterium]
MLKRPVQHITETASKKIFEGLVPDGWVIRTLSPDYGIDYLIEVFKDGTSTGIQFYIQLKGISRKTNAQHCSLSIDLKYLEYYESLPIPILFVVVNVTSSYSWGIWANDILKNYKPNKSAKKIPIAFGVEKRVTTDFFKSIEQNLPAALIGAINFSHEFEGTLAGMIARKVRQWIKFLYNDLATENPHLPSSMRLSYHDKNSMTQVSVRINKGNLKKTVGRTIKAKLNDIYFNKPIFSDSDWDNRLEEILLLITISFFSRKIEAALYLLERTIDRKSEFMRVEVLMPIFSMAAANQKTQLVQRIYLKALTSQQYDKCQIINIIYMMLGASNQEILELYRANLGELDRTLTNDRSRAIVCYNLANSIKADKYPTFNSKRNAITYYFKAARLDKSYLERPYWWREVAGLFFVTNHYMMAEKFYLKAKYLGDNDPLVDLLVADCIFFQGKFDEAATIFRSTFKDEDDFNDEWNLKDYVGRFLNSNGLSNKILNRDASSVLTDQAIEVEDHDKALELLVMAIDLNPLNGLAWFYYSIELDREDKRELALMSWITTCIMQDWDREAWFQALLRAIALRDRVMVPIIKTMMSKFTRVFINDFSDFLMSSHPQMDIEMKLKLNAILLETVEQIEELRKNRESKSE